MQRYRLHSVPARGAPAGDGEPRRAAPRTSVYTISVLVFADELPAPLPCTVHDISSSGARLELDPEGVKRYGHAPPLPRNLRVYFRSDMTEVACRLAWRDGRHFGIEFAGERQCAARLI